MAKKEVCLYNPGVACDGGECSSCGWSKNDALVRFTELFELVEKKPAKPKNPYWERICRLSERQRAKGMETYGQGLENNPAAITERLNHLEEELIDALMYCEWIKEWLANG